VGDIITGSGMFSKLGEKWFDDYWMNYRKITKTNENNFLLSRRNYTQVYEY